MMTEWDGSGEGKCPRCGEAFRLPPWPTSGEYACVNGCYRGYAYPNLRRIAGQVQVVDDIRPDDLPYWLLTRANVLRMALVACGLFWTAVITAAVEIFR